MTEELGNSAAGLADVKASKSSASARLIGRAFVDLVVAWYSHQDEMVLRSFKKSR